MRKRLVSPLDGRVSRLQEMAPKCDANVRKQQAKNQNPSQTSSPAHRGASAGIPYQEIVLSGTSCVNELDSSPTDSLASCADRTCRSVTSNRSGPEVPLYCRLCLAVQNEIQHVSRRELFRRCLKRSYHVPHMVKFCSEMQLLIWLPTVLGR